jgi:hypothetical protein
MVVPSGLSTLQNLIDLMHVSFLMTAHEVVSQGDSPAVDFTFGFSQPLRV